MSIFSGWTWEKLKIAYETAKNTPEGLAAVAVIGLVMVLALAFAGVMMTHHIGGFYARIQEEEEAARREEEEEEEKRRSGGQSDQPAE